MPKRSSNCAKSTSPFSRGRFHCPVHEPSARRRPRRYFLVTTIASAELIKHASNSFLGLKISYANLDCRSLREAGRQCGRSHPGHGARSAHRTAIPERRSGFWRFLLAQGHSGVHPSGGKPRRRFQLAARSRGDQQAPRRSVLEKVRQALWVVKDKKVGVLGLAFKPNTDDIRFAPAIEVRAPPDRRRRHGAGHRSGGDRARSRRSEKQAWSLCQDPYEVARGADALLLLTEWQEYRDLDWQRIYAEMARPAGPGCAQYACRRQR